ncbi:STAS domain-containing protein [Amycolatopsis sp. NPDC098790]|uniref:STAS domain-containing protein n=1 Tax=Amycolatopsis sp. NPDC098790 TaxID=3363939 RepID=UPI003821F2C3
MSDEHVDRGVSITVRTLPGAVVLKVAGELDLASAPQLSKAIFTQLGHDPAGLILDLEHLTFCTSAGLHAMAHAATVTSTKKISFVVAAAQRTVARVFEIVGMSEVIMLVADLDAAYAWVTAPSPPNSDEEDG